MFGQHAGLACPWPPWPPRAPLATPHQPLRNRLQCGTCRYILCNEELKALFGVDSFQGFGMQKLLAPHIIK